jgi:putative heme transporter
MIRSNSRTGSRHAVGARTAITDDRPSGHSLLRPLLLRLTLLALVGVGIASQRHALLAGVGSLSRLSPAWFAVAILAEVMSFAALAEVQRRLLSAGGIRIGLGTMLLVGYASGAVSASLPAGSALGTGYTYRQLTKRGATPALAARSIVATGTLALSSLAFLGLIGAQLWGVGLICSALGGLIGGSVAVGASLLVVATVWICRPQIPLETFARWLAKLADVARRVTGRRSPQAIGPSDLSHWSKGRDRASPLLGHGRWAGALALAAVNWLADFATLAIAFFALGLSVPWQTLGFAYVVGQVVTSVPFVPSAFGVAEASMAAALIHAGVRPDHAFAAVLVYRLVTRGILLPAGWLAWAGLRRRDHLSRAPFRESAPGVRRSVIGWWRLRGSVAGRARRPNPAAGH